MGIFGKNILVVLISALALYVAIGAGARALRIAPEFTPNFALDERLQYLKTHRPAGQAVGIALGASLSSNDISTTLLQSEMSKPYVNLGAYGLNIEGAKAFYTESKNEFAIRDVIFPMQFFELRPGTSTFEISPDLFHRYISGKMTFLEEASYRDVGGLFYYLSNWNDLRTPEGYSSVVFTPTGDVPLDIGPRTADWARWSVPAASGFSASPCGACMKPLVDLCNAVTSDHRRFLLVLTPYRRTVVNASKDLLDMYNDRQRRIPAAMQSCGGRFVDFNASADFDDSCFADFAHLNRQGARFLTEMLIGYLRTGTMGPRKTIVCPQYAVGHT